MKRSKKYSTTWKHAGEIYSELGPALTKTVEPPELVVPLHPEMPSTKNDNVWVEDKDSDGENKFSYRLDVVKKTIFRKFKKYYRNQFKDFYDYNKARRQSIHKQSERIFTNARNYLHMKFGKRWPESLELYLVAIIDVKKKYVHENGDYYDIRLKIADLINSFNVDRAEDILNDYHISYLFYTLNDEFVKEIIDQKGDLKLQTLYLEQLKLIKIRWSEVLCQLGK